MHLASGRLPMKIMSSTSIRGSASAFSLEKRFKDRAKEGATYRAVSKARVKFFLLSSLLSVLRMTSSHLKASGKKEWVRAQKALPSAQLEE